MSLVQRDYIQRMIEAVAAAIARMLRRRQSGDLPGARAEVHTATTELLGPVARVAMHADAKTAVDLIGDLRRVTAWARLLIEDAETLRMMDQLRDADANEHRAFDLLCEVERRGPLDAETNELFDALRGRVQRSGI